MIYGCISERLWEQLEPLLPTEGSPYGGRPPGDVRFFLNAVHWILRSGAPWRALPCEFGSWKTVYSRFRRWQKRGFWDAIFTVLTKVADMESVMIDGTYIHAHKHSSGARRCSGTQAIGRSRGGLTSKLHAVVDALGYPLRLKLTGGHCSDISQAFQLLAPYHNCNTLADRGYDCDALITQLQDQNCIPVIPPKRNRLAPRTIDRHLYNERHLIENFFNKIKEYRRVATRYDKLDVSFLAFIVFASTLIWLR